MLKAIIFDLDGCLIDSTEVQKKAFFDSYKIVVGDDKCPTYEEYIKHTGESIDNVLRIMKLPCEMADCFRKISRELVANISVKWEAIELIRKLRNCGIKIAICTGKDHERTEEVLNYYGIKKFFDVLVCADDVEKPKPSSEPILKAMGKMAVNSPESVVLVGDGYNDILAAKNAGIKSIMTLWYGDVGVEKVADYTVESVPELEKLVNDIL